MGNIGTQAIGIGIGRPNQILAGGYGKWEAIGGSIYWPAVIAAVAAGNNPGDNMPFAAGDKYLSLGQIMVRVRSGALRNWWVPFSSVGAVLTPVAAPVVAPSVGGGTFAAGDYKVGYAYRTEYGTTATSPLTTVTVALNGKIDVSPLALPPGVVSVDWFVSKAANGADIAFYVNNAGNAPFSITGVPAGGAAEEPTVSTIILPGQDTLTRGHCGIVNMSLREKSVMFGLEETSESGWLRGGRIWSERLLVGGAGQPTLDAVLTAMPELVPAPPQ